MKDYPLNEIINDTIRGFNFLERYIVLQNGSEGDCEQISRKLSEALEDIGKKVEIIKTTDEGYSKKLERGLNGVVYIIQNPFSSFKVDLTVDRFSFISVNVGYF